MTLTDRILLIVNPISGTHDKRALLERVASHPQCTAVSTAYPGHASLLAADAARAGAKAVIAVGGDGTVRETALGLLGTSTPLGIIPCGSGNGLARHLCIPTDPTRALSIIEDWHIEACDYGSVDMLPFFCTMGVGFDAEVAHRFAQSGHRGAANYVRAVMAAFHNYEPRVYRINLPDRSITRRAMLVTVANGAQYGNNARIAPEASITDGLLDVIILNAGDKAKTLLAAMQLFTGHILANPLIETYRVPAVEILPEEAEGAPVNIHLDGDPAQESSPLQVKVHRAALHILTPKGKKV